MAKRKTPVTGKKTPVTPVIMDDGKELYDWSHLSEKQKGVMQAFVKEYMRDFNATQAALRMGLSDTPKSAKVVGHNYLYYPYTQWYMRQYADRIEEKAIVKRADVVNGLLREANFAVKFESSHSARVAAWKTLGKILGMEVVKIDMNIGTNGGGVMRIPAEPTMLEWSAAAEKTQADLKARVVD